MKADEWDEASGICGLKVIRKTGIYEGQKEKELMQLERLLEKYDHRDAVITADAAMAEYLGICGEYQVRYDRMFNRVMDNSKVLKATNLHQEDFKSIEHGLKDELSANIELLQHIRPNIVQNAKIDKICGIINCPDSTIIDKLQYFQFRFPNVGIVPRLLAALLRRMNKR